MRTWLNRKPTPELGIATGTASRVVVIDVDPRDGGLDSLAALEAELGPLPETVTAASGGPDGGEHRYFRCPEGGLPSTILAPGLDVKADGGYVRAVGSIHPSGGVCAWIVPPEERKLAALDAPWVARIAGVVPSAKGKIPEGARDVKLTSLAGSLVRAGMGERTIEAALQAVNERECDPPLPAKQVAKIARSIASRDARRVSAPEPRSAEDLVRTELPEVREIVERILPAGLALLTSRPKIGKTDLAASLAVELATGRQVLGDLAAASGNVLGLFLEDNERRLRRRFTTVRNGRALERLHWVTAWPRLDAGGADAIEAQLDKLPGTVLVIVDTLEAIRPARGKNAYADDYASAASLKRIADERNIAFLVLHHDRKASTGDHILDVSGTNGLAGSVDTVLSLRRDRGRCDATLQVSGRDVEECDLALKRDPATARWTIAGDAREFRMSEQRAEIVALLRTEGSLKPSEVADALERSRGAVRWLMHQAARDGDLERLGDGRYTVRT